MATVPEYPVTLRLEEIAKLAGGELRGPGEVEARGLTHDSRKVRRGMLFCAVPGRERDGRAFVPEALASGAAAVLAEAPPDSDVAWIRVPRVRRALGPLAQRFYGEPSRELAVVGITGTNGKTTTSFLTAAVLEAGLGSAAALGTLGLRRGERVLATGFTTPEAPDLAPLMRMLVEEGVRGLAMEVSSHALAQGRVAGVRFAAGVFTNLTHEHLDYHGTLEAYRDAKLLLFDQLRAADAYAVVNLDDPSAEAFRARSPRRLLTYSLEREHADVRAEEMDLGADGSRVRVAVAGERLDLRVRLGGRFNVSNALAALGVGVALDVPPRRAADAIGSVERVPGRFELYQGGGRTVLIDYAHTPDAFRRVLASARQLARGEVTLIFGCGGERDRDKRAVMGEIAGRLADRVYLTLDNPRREPVERIMQDVAEGLTRAAARWRRIDDRERAFREALEESRPGDLIALLGKGDEGYQEIEGVKRPYSDREVARRGLASLEGRKEVGIG